MKNFMNVTLLLRMVQKIGNSLIAFSPVLTRMSVAQIYGTGFTPSLKKSMALAGLMSLASVGAYASTKSAAEGEVDTPIESLIPMAQDFIKNNNVDLNNDRVINYKDDKELLLTGTLSNSIEDLTTEVINKKLANEDAEKIFTTFMATNNQEQIEKNINTLSSSKNYISETYDQLIRNMDSISSSLDSTDSHLVDLIIKIYYAKEMDVELKQEAVYILEKLQSDLLKTCISLKNVNEEYRNITTQNFTPILDNIEVFESHLSPIEQQIQKIDTISVIKDQVTTEMVNFDETVRFAKEEFSIYPKLYANQKENDIKLLETLLEKQAKFAEDGKSSAEEQAVSKELLKELVEKASPMTRNNIIKLAEEQYKPENDPTGIVDISAGALSKMCFDLTGKQLAKPREGLNIVKSAEGTVQKVIVQ
ncbi:MAG: hypothetical protein K6E73_12325 [Bacteroidales bacterium]|nr:hypothetical protein [Bacteroidales bacterium]